MSIAIVTDSTCDIPGELAEHYHIHIVPNTIVIEGRPYEDGKEISREAFYSQLLELQSLPTTATASSGAYQTLYEMLFRRGAERIFSIHASGLLSGIINAASAAARLFGDRVQVVDSQQVSLGLGYQVLAAAEAVAKGASGDTVQSVLENVRRRVHLIAMLDTLEYIRRSGRVSWARARLGDLLRIKPFVSLREGVVHSLGEARTRRKGIARLKEMLLALGPLERLGILHTNAEEDARQFLNELHPDLPGPPLVVNVTTVIGTHVGPGGLGFVAIVR